MTTQEKIETLTSASSTVQHDILILQERRRNFIENNVDTEDPVIKLIDNILEQQNKTYNNLAIMSKELIKQMVEEGEQK